MQCNQCGVPAVALFGTGPKCGAHTPAAVAGRPEPSPPAPIPGRIRVPDQSRYGTATTDPLGREGPGWHKGPSGLPVRDKRETKGDR